MPIPREHHRHRHRPCSRGILTIASHFRRRGSGMVHSPIFVVSAWPYWSNAEETYMTSGDNLVLAVPD